MVSDPTRYQIEFRVDGSVAIQADCNSVLGSYEVGENNSVTIQLGPSTLVACPEDSQADAFLEQLSATTAFEFSFGALVLNAADAGTSMTFQMLPIAILPTPEANTPSAQANTGVNVRSGPSTEHTIFGVLQSGRQAQVVGKNEEGTWWALNLPVSPTGSGWVSGDFVTVSNADNVPVLPAPPVPPTVGPVAPGPSDPQVTVLQPAHVRQGPGDVYPAYGIAQPGRTGLVIGRSEDGTHWVVRIDPSISGSGFGWVQASLVQAQNTENAPVIATPPAPAPVPMPPPPATNAPTAIAMTAVNLRTGPSTAYPVLGVAQTGQSGEITGVSEDGTWWQVRVPTSISADGRAWVSGAYVSAFNTANVPVVTAPPPPPPVEEPPPPDTSENLIITIEPLNVRAGPGNQYESYGLIPAGTVLEVTGQSGIWLSVAIPSLPGGIGWISGNYVMPYTGPIAVPFE
jgi:uncharacterized protein YraI